MSSCSGGRHPECQQATNQLYGEAMRPSSIPASEVNENTEAALLRDLQTSDRFSRTNTHMGTSTWPLRIPRVIPSSGISAPPVSSRSTNERFSGVVVQPDGGENWIPCMVSVLASKLPLGLYPKMRTNNITTTSISLKLSYSTIFTF